MIAEFREPGTGQQSKAANSSSKRSAAPLAASADGHKVLVQRALPKAPLLDWPSLRMLIEARLNGGTQAKVN